MSEIPVTHEMIEAAYRVMGFTISRIKLDAAYRAMRALEPPTGRGEPAAMLVQTNGGLSPPRYANNHGKAALVCDCGHPENAASCDRWGCPFLRDPLGR